MRDRWAHPRDRLGVKRYRCARRDAERRRAVMQVRALYTAAWPRPRARSGNPHPVARLPRRCRVPGVDGFPGPWWPRWSLSSRMARPSRTARRTSFGQHGSRSYLGTTCPWQGPEAGRQGQTFVTGAAGSRQPGPSALFGDRGRVPPRLCGLPSRGGRPGPLPDHRAGRPATPDSGGPHPSLSVAGAPIPRDTRAVIGNTRESVAETSLHPTRYGGLPDQGKSPSSEVDDDSARSRK